MIRLCHKSHGMLQQSVNPISVHSRSNSRSLKIMRTLTEVKRKRLIVAVFAGTNVQSYPGEDAWMYLRDQAKLLGRTVQTRTGKSISL